MITLFLWFMQNNSILYKSDGAKRISNGALVALTLMIAESRPEEKDVMVKVVKIQGKILRKTAETEMIQDAEAGIEADRIRVNKL